MYRISPRDSRSSSFRNVRSMSRIDQVRAQLINSPKTWLITGVAGFIGSNLLEELLKLGQFVVGVDNFSTGHARNLEDVRREVGERRWPRFVFHEGDVEDIDFCRKACGGIDYVLHQAALGSVPRSIEDPVRTNLANVCGFLNMIVAARDAGVRMFVYATSSATYGDHPELPKVEDRIGKALSPYAVTKYVNELYADVFAACFGMSSIGLRYFNVFGKRQDPNGAYAAVIPKWIGAFLNLEKPVINGDGESSRDFCYIEDVVQANLLAAVSDGPPASSQVYNIAFGERTTLNQLCGLIKQCLLPYAPEIQSIEPVYGPFRKGDVRHSLASVSKAAELLGYRPACGVSVGLEKSARWFVDNLGSVSKKSAGIAARRAEQ